jgi:hypothetical protein
MLAFRSLLIPAVAAVMNLLAAGAAFGVLVAVFQYGWDCICSTSAHRGRSAPPGPRSNARHGRGDRGRPPGSRPQGCPAEGPPCGICGTDASFVQMGGMLLGPGGPLTAITLGHEPAGEIIEAGAEVTGPKPGDRVVVTLQAAPSGIIGCGGAQGGMSEYLLIENARVATSVAVFPDTAHAAHRHPQGRPGASDTSSDHA